MSNLKNNQDRVTIKGRVGDFEYGYVVGAKRQWVVRSRIDGSIVATAQDLSGASSAAQKHYKLGR